MRRLLFLLCAVAAFAANSRLYLTDGTYHSVREYQVLADRVRYYSIERSDWEEIPLTLVDLKRTQAELADRQAELAAEKKIEAEENQAERDLRREIRSVPPETGVYLLGESFQFRALAQAELEVVNNKRRSILKTITPIPIISGKATVEIKEAQSKFVVTSDRPEFYFRLSGAERFGLVKLWAGNGKSPSRIVERWEIVPVVKEVVKEHQDIEIFRKQASEDLYKVWPVEPLAPGEYAWIEYTEGKGNTQAWDFSIRR